MTDIHHCFAIVGKKIVGQWQAYKYDGEYSEMFYLVAAALKDGATTLEAFADNHNMFGTANSYRWDDVSGTIKHLNCDHVLVDFRTGLIHNTERGTMTFKQFVAQNDLMRLVFEDSYRNGELSEYGLQELVDELPSVGIEIDGIEIDEDTHTVQNIPNVGSMTWINFDEWANDLFYKKSE